MTLIQTYNEHLSKILVNSLINEVAIRCCNQFRREFKVSHLHRSIMSAKINLEIGAKQASLGEEGETIVLTAERICLYPWKSIVYIAINCLQITVIKSLKDSRRHRAPIQSDNPERCARKHLVFH